MARKSEIAAKLEVVIGWWFMNGVVQLGIGLGDVHKKYRDRIEDR